MTQEHFALCLKELHRLQHNNVSPYLRLKPRTLAEARNAILLRNVVRALEVRQPATEANYGHSDK